MKKLVVVLVLVLVVAAAVVALNVHNCDYCKEIFFGDAYHTEKYGDICHDCYRLFGDFIDGSWEEFF